MWPSNGVRRSVVLMMASALVVGCSGQHQKTFSGIGPTMTLPFTMEGPWQLRCEYQGPFMRIIVLGEYGERTGMTFSHQGGGQAMFIGEKPGTYSLEVQTNDGTSWTITIFEPT